MVFCATAIYAIQLPGSCAGTSIKSPTHKNLLCMYVACWAEPRQYFPSEHTSHPHLLYRGGSNPMMCRASTCLSSTYALRNCDSLAFWRAVLSLVFFCIFCMGGVRICLHISTCWICTQFWWSAYASMCGGMHSICIVCVLHMRFMRGQRLVCCHCWW